MEVHFGEAPLRLRSGQAPPTLGTSAFPGFHQPHVMRKRRVVVLGATGSIGESAQKVARDIPERMEIVGMSAHSNEDKLRAAGREFPQAKLAVSSGPDGVEKLVELATLPEADLVLIAIVGTGGL